MTFTLPSSDIQMNLFPPQTVTTEVCDFVAPKPYTGLAGFHKYWGKKPVESMSFLIEKCTSEGDIVMDPFLGSGLVARESLLRNRRFVGIDINPFATEHANFLLNLPSRREYYRALLKIESLVAEKINRTYLTSGEQIASHYLWEGNSIASVWIKPGLGRIRVELKPSDHDMQTFNSYKDYRPKYFRELKFFTNSRINVNPNMSISDIFTNRAIRNIDLLIDSFSDFPPVLKRALLLTLTSSAGQMSNMVFAIKNRSVSKGQIKDGKIEVGSWVVGFWLPETHFEINVWHCFKSRSSKLLRALPLDEQTRWEISANPVSVGAPEFHAWLVNSDCRTALKKMPSRSISFVCTDPPHSDRVPYLELSELWNALLGYAVDFEREIVVSNAKERRKSKTTYNSEMTEFFQEADRVLKPGGYIALYYNARDKASWQYLKSVEKISDTLKFVGCFPITYSATSVVQDNRKGAMKNDYIVLYHKQNPNSNFVLPNSFLGIPGWSLQFPL